MRVIVKQKVQREVLEPVELDLIEKWVMKVWQGQNKLEEKTFRTEPSKQDIAEVLFKYRNKKNVEATVHHKYKLIEGVTWEDM